MIRVPKFMLETPERHRRIQADNMTVIESCHHHEVMEDHAFVSQHEVIHIRSGKLILLYDAEQSITIAEGETAIIRKGTYFGYKKFAGTKHYESVLIFLKPEFVEEFLLQYTNDRRGSSQITNVVKLSPDPIVSNYMTLMLSYIDSGMLNDPKLIKLKTFELLYNLTKLRPEVNQYLVDLTLSREADLVGVMEANYKLNLTLEEFAELTGRSVSTFKREFTRVYKVSPHQWLKEKRLSLAQRLLRQTTKKPSDIFMEVGFEDLAHFSRSYKSRFGYNPSQEKRTMDISKAS